MSDHQPSFGRSYRPWGQVKRRNLISRVLYAMMMTVIGLAVLAGMVLLFVFAASVAVAAVVAFGLMGLAALFTRKPSQVRVHSDNGKGVYEARRRGSTWTVY